MCRSVPRAMRFRVIGLALAFLWLSPLRAAAETVRVAHPLLAPFTYVQNGKTVGLVADILRAAAAREGIEIVFVPESPAQLQETLSNGSPEAIAPMPIGSPKYDFTTPFVVTGGALFVRAPNSAPAGLAALSGKTVITPKDGPFVAFIAQNFPRVTTVRAAGAAMSDEYAQSLSAVVSGCSCAEYPGGCEGRSSLIRGQDYRAHDDVQEFCARPRRAERAAFRSPKAPRRRARPREGGRHAGAHRSPLDRRAKSTAAFLGSGLRRLARVCGAAAHAERGSAVGGSGRIRLIAN